MTTRKTVTIERSYDATIEDVWELWTTKDGIESWWGPDGFSVVVHEMDLRVGGTLRYAMNATGAPQIEFMKKAGMPLSSEVRCTYAAVDPRTRLAFATFVDFIPGVKGYDVGTMVDLHPVASGVRLVLTLDAMHEDLWTERAVQGWQSELGKLDRLLQGRT
ncbi:SRPBCC domain-containing protein [soil metagenome]